MVEHMKPEEILRLNPHISEGELNKIGEFIRRLRESGIEGKRYELASIDRRRASVGSKGDGETEHPRAIHLRPHRR
ncbi:MAG: hypothetical protein DDT24_00754 [Chloroflexi bacterium]|nr:hypothetical protein [Chloroflexota bacterium]MBT9166482.1 hypothetical protein [Chloroflexota bacterium]